jgi:MFS transporter, putative metabolite:H+ symporter
MSSKCSPTPSVYRTAVLVAALGYFVDVYDIGIFSIVRISSLKALGVASEDLMSAGVTLLNAQMFGMLLGGILWGILGDKRGRLQVLFGSIFLYSAATFLNAFVVSINQYWWCRFVAGIGLAGEIGAGITLVSELLPPAQRGLGTTIVTSMGILGGLCASLVGDYLAWKFAFLLGGIMGFFLLVLRISVTESSIFHSAKTNSSLRRGSLFLLINSRKRFSLFSGCVLVGLPLWFVYGVVISFSPELGRAMGATEPIVTAKCVLWFSIGLTLGDVASGIACQKLRSRKKVLTLFLTLSGVALSPLITLQGLTPLVFYALCFPIGFFLGYWVVLITSCAELFGTNLRATVTTLLPNLIRASVIPLTLLTTSLSPSIGLHASIVFLAITVYLGALWGLFLLTETYGVSMSFVEETTDRRESKKVLKMAVNS